MVFVDTIIEMTAEMITRTLLRSAKSIAEDELDVSSTEAELAIFYRLCIERDRIQDTSCVEGLDSSENPVH